MRGDNLFPLSVSLLLITLLLFSSSSATPPEGWVRGVSPAEQGLFKGSVFPCRRDPTKKIPINHVNDNYCDCPDGSDEPGTAACKAGTFWCTNKGYLGEYIFSSRVNDGICDCCDGSDEHEGNVKCINTCGELRAKAFQQKQLERDQYEKGLKSKEERIAEAPGLLKVKREEAEKTRQEIEDLKKRTKELEEEKAAIEEEEKNEKAALEEAKEAEKQRKEKEELERIQNGGEPLTPEAKLEEELEQADQDAEYPTKTSEETEALKSILEEKKSIETEINTVRGETHNKERILRELDALLALDFGPQLEFYALHKKCFDFKSREYTYTFCGYDTTKQNGMSLGNFEKWDPAYTVMSFTDGQQCWGGPKRSTKITLVCGEKDELYEAAEPAKCEYAMKFTTPAACSSTHYEMLLHEAGIGEAPDENYFEFL